MFSISFKGSETTSTTDLFVLMMLGMHQEIQVVDKQQSS